MVGFSASAFDWTRSCEVLAWEPEVGFSWSVGDRFDGSPATRCTFRLRTMDDSTVRGQEFAHCPDGLSDLRAGAEGDPAKAAELVQVRAQQLHDGINDTLARMKRITGSVGGLRRRDLRALTGPRSR